MPGAAATEPLAARSVHVWLVAPEQIADPTLLAGWAAWLDERERVRWQRFRFERDRHRFLVSHALVRSVLSQYADVRPGDWQFRETAHGRPELAGPLRGAVLRFNLSHTAGLAACAVAWDCDIGVDVETLDRRTPTLELARRYFASDEVRQLFGRPADSQASTFFEFWTLKEAYIKARGRGLSLPLDEFAFLLREGEAPLIRYSADFDADPSGWQFAQTRPTPRHQAALAAWRGTGGPLAIDWRWWPGDHC